MVEERYEDEERELPPSGAVEDQWVDQLMPSGFDWVSVVRQHPMATLTVAAVGGFLIGRWHGRQVIDAASELAAGKVSASVDRFLDLG